jgi:pyridoxine kinase
MLDALDANGWLGEIDGILTGYLPSAAHVVFAADAVRRIRARSPRALFLCDPVLGDDPKGLYVATEAADAVRDIVLPLADIATPNRFELSWLSGTEVTDIGSAIAAARKLAPETVIATSIPEGHAALGAIRPRGAAHGSAERHRRHAGGPVSRLDPVEGRRCARHGGDRHQGRDRRQRGSG